MKFINIVSIVYKNMKKEIEIINVFILLLSFGIFGIYLSILLYKIKWKDLFKNLLKLIKLIISNKNTLIVVGSVLVIGAIALMILSKVPFKNILKITNDKYINWFGIAFTLSMILFKLVSIKNIYTKGIGEGILIIYSILLYLTLLLIMLFSNHVKQKIKINNQTNNNQMTNNEIRIKKENKRLILLSNISYYGMFFLITILFVYNALRFKELFND